LAGYAMTIGLVVPPAPFFPASHVNHATFLHTTGLPVQLFHGLFAVALTACLWHYMVLGRKISGEIAGHARMSLYLHGLAAGMLLVIIAGWFLTNAVGQHTTHEMQRFFLAYARGARTMEAFFNGWQQQIATHRLAVIGATGIMFFLMAGALLSAQNFQDNREKIIADHCKAEAELRRAKDAAEAATRAKTEFLTNMSHEIRTPITAILGYTDLLLEPDVPEAEQQQHLRTIQRNGRALLDLISDILDVSKIEAGRLELERMACSPWQILNDVVAMMRVRTDGKGLSLSLESGGPLPETIFTDPTRLRQILVNLVGNAVKFTEIGGVRIVARLLRCEGQEPKMQFDVIDTGIGMTSDQSAMIFHAFTQADAATNRKYGGTGLGLTISKRLAAMLGGDITVASEPNRGSTFSFTIVTGSLDGVPMVQCLQPTPKETVGATAKPRPTLRGRILLAEDGPDNQRLISLVLRKAGAEVVIAQNGKEAVERAMASHSGWGRRHGEDRKPFDLVLMDIQMPIMDGLEATRRLRQEGFAAPIIALSAHATTEAAQQCLDAGCNDYLTKPIDRELLIQKIIAALQVASSAWPTELAADRPASPSAV
jgi:signal transduction histidine kinase/AmiR/NasT family two-component response regulator